MTRDLTNIVKETKPNVNNFNFEEFNNRMDKLWGSYRLKHLNSETGNHAIDQWRNYLLTLPNTKKDTIIKSLAKDYNVSYDAVKRDYTTFKRYAIADMPLIAEPRKYL